MRHIDISTKKTSTDGNRALATTFTEHLRLAGLRSESRWAATSTPAGDATISLA